MGEQFSEENVFRVAFGIESPELREEYLKQVSVEDPSLYDRVHALLAFNSDAPDFLEPPPNEIAATIDQPALAEKSGTMIGPYKLYDQIGEGGMGLVYRAVQKEPIRRKVALKIIKPGMDSRQVINRFEAERQALALMDHPNIARVIDGGTTESGRPYFVMELVKGMPITGYCDRYRLTTNERLALFGDVCSAVQHAHQKGIIHRDLKPSNILVTLLDGKAIAKVIDFGIAKAVSGHLTDNSLVTAHTQMVGTPLYMSPEQADLSAVDVDTRSDVYSLGVLLYELLTGTTPFDGERMSSVSFDEFRRIVREEDPPRPSTRLSTLDAALETVADKHHTDPRTLSREVADELDWIVMKALEKDRTRRYESANELAKDVQRYLDDEAVEACPPSTIYRLRKLARRNKTVVLATVAVSLALILGAGIATGQAVRATRAEANANEQLEIAKEQRRLASRQAKLAKEAEQRERKLRGEAEAARNQADAVTDYLVEVFRSPDPERDGRDVTVVELLDQSRKQLDEKYGDDLVLKARLLKAIGTTYAGLGLNKEAVEILEQSRGLFRDELGIKHPASLEGLADLISAYVVVGRFAEAAKVGEEGLKLQREVLGPEHPETVNAMVCLVPAYLWQDGMLADAVSMGEEAVKLARKVFGPEHPTTLSAMNNVAYAYNPVEQRDKILELREEIVRIGRKTRGTEHPRTLAHMNNLASQYKDIGRYADALKLHEETLPLLRRVRGAEHVNTIVSMNNLASIYRDVGRLDDAIRLHDKAWPLAKDMVGPNHPYTVNIMSSAAATYRMAGRFDQAIRIAEEAFDAGRDRERGQMTANLAATYLAIGNWQKTIELYQEARGEQGDGQVSLDMTACLAAAYSLAGRHDEALTIAKDVLSRTREHLGTGHPQALVATCLLAQILCEMADYEQAVDLLEQTLPLVRKQLGAKSLHTIECMQHLAVAYSGLARHAQATSLHEETLKLSRETLGPEHPQTLSAMLLLGSDYGEHERYVDAEPLLLDAHAGYTKRQESYPTPYDGRQVRETCEQLVQLYEKWDKPEEAQAWEKQLSALNNNKEDDGEN